MNREEKRDFINILRGLAIFLVLWGHAIQYFSTGDFDFFENTVFKAIYSFHMPLLMLISGYLFYFSLQKRNLKEILVHKAQNLLQPIIFGTILYILLTSVAMEMLKFEIGSLFDLVNNAFSKTNTYWFLWSTLACSVAVSIIYKVTDKFLLKFLLLFAGLGIICILPCSTFNVYMFPFFILGFWFAEIPEGRVKTFLLKIKYLSIPLFPVMLLFFKKDHYIYTSGMHIFRLSEFKLFYLDVYRWAIGFVGSVFTITIAKIVVTIVKKYSNISKKSLIYKLGEKSLQVYILQKIILEFWLNNIYSKIIEDFNSGVNVLSGNMLLFNWIITPLIAVSVGIVCLLFAKLLEKSKISNLIFGR